MAATAVALCLAAACTASSTDDDGGEELAPVELPDDDGRPDTAAATAATADLELLSDQRATLRFGEPTTLAVRLTDRNGDPVDNQPIGFALMGRAQDAALAELEVVTDADGRAENRLMAGEVVATFRVRISAPGAGDLYVDVRVSNAGFGTLLVDAPYDGPRTVEQRSVAALANMDCEQAVRMAGDPMTTLTPETGDEPAEFLALPAEVSYAVMASAEGADGTVLARGCVDGVMLGADDQVRIEVAFEDEPLVAGGRYDAVLTLDTSAPAATLQKTFRDALELAIVGDAVSLETVNAEAGFLLDSLELTLGAEPLSTTDGVPELLAALQDAREEPGEVTPEQSLAAELELGALGPRAAAIRLSELLGAQLQGVEIGAGLSLAEDGILTTTVERWSTLPAMEGASVVSIEGSGEPDLSQVEPDLTGDSLVLPGSRLTSSLGTLAAETAGVLLSTAGTAAELHTLAGCAELGPWLQGQAFDTGACDASCLEMACDRTLTRMLSAGQGALTALDESRPSLELAGTLALTDDDGDLAVEQMSGGMLSGQWDDPSDPDGELEPITGALVASTGEDAGDAAP